MGEVPRQFGRREHHRSRGGLQLREPLPLIADEEKEPLLAVNQLGNNDRAAYGSAELVPLQNGLGQRVWSVGVVEEEVGIERIVADVVVQRAVIQVRAGLGYHADDPAAVAAVLRAV